MTCPEGSDERASISSHLTLRDGASHTRRRELTSSRCTENRGGTCTRKAADRPAADVHVYTRINTWPRRGSGTPASDKEDAGCRRCRVGQGGPPVQRCSRRDRARATERDGERERTRESVALSRTRASQAWEAAARSDPASVAPTLHRASPSWTRRVCRVSCYERERGTLGRLNVPE